MGTMDRSADLRVCCVAMVCGSHPRNAIFILGVRGCRVLQQQWGVKKYTRSSLNCCGTRSKKEGKKITSPALSLSSLSFFSYLFFFICTRFMRLRAKTPKQKFLWFLPPSLSLCLTVSLSVGGMWRDQNSLSRTRMYAHTDRKRAHTERKSCFASSIFFFHRHSSRSKRNR